MQAVEYETPSTELIFSVDTTIDFSDGTGLSAQFWRLTKKGRPEVSIFDHRRQYGLPAPIDALSILRHELVGRTLLVAELDQTTADLRFMFEGELRLEVFNFTGFEIWELTFPDGTGELSNYALED
ncbi:hypothetical protein ACFVVM_05575 [Nocardia sp. NPDC058176]|uniref:hypothetical protein n=1 Tax=Nocardia sp. NPDC058176 TaxID=3346368 RepID=UPI0036DAFE9E